MNECVYEEMMMKKEVVRDGMEYVPRRGTPFFFGRVLDQHFFSSIVSALEGLGKKKKETK